MKKNKYIVKLFIGFVTLSAGFTLSEYTFATSEETMAQEKIIATSSQKLAQLKETKQNISKQLLENEKQHSTVGVNIQKIQIDLDQLEKIESTTTISEVAELKDEQALTLTTSLSPVEVQEDTMTKKTKQLTELKQKQNRLTLEKQNISTQQADMQKQETQLSKKIAQAQKQKDEQSKQTNTHLEIVAAAKTHLGKPYVYGAAGPDAFDCSGLVQVAFASAGRSIGRTTVDQETAGETIPVSEAQAGDLVFWGSHGGTHHVAISLGDGSYIHAPVPGDVVQIATVASYSPDFAIRIL
ncbi:hypothetical protein UAY_00756 [Enterococcus moraviensis ATCC BAA-383]|uniref:NlpC/P60 domain-containing protein n=1 Tax=Enterococcus moraviensis ATCC BAA-383 TaxID=1158609 RepID=R2R5F1_9ENTE|nr:C40 family peptidase [Enterococcus moraviensis]EOI03011.1 hypothetical protein UAY_00756 [Enterococcus moraviensis ATCC BAA-383]EOT74112.1 hypothetical protein I586_01110 [Enterococcus moraviensis ATCC BAA-383]OJG67195.1 hypothetical protein RV09_GL002761 [Enterococcus moraviensis]